MLISCWAIVNEKTSLGPIIITWWHNRESAEISVRSPIDSCTAPPLHRQTLFFVFTLGVKPLKKAPNPSFLIKSVKIFVPEVLSWKSLFWIRVYAVHRRDREIWLSTVARYRSVSRRLLPWSHLMAERRWWKRQHLQRMQGNLEERLHHYTFPGQTHSLLLLLSHQIKRMSQEHYELLSRPILCYRSRRQGEKWSEQTCSYRE